MNKLATVPGSLQAISQANNQPLAVSFMDANAVILIDVSGSMDECDVTGKPGKSRWQVACDELARLQASLPGKVAVISFATNPIFCPGGKPPPADGATKLAAALEFVHVADDCGLTFVIISDGSPDSPSAAMDQAKRFKSPISTIYIGPEGGDGADFLRQLASATRGKSSTNSVAMLAESVRLMLPAGGAA